jgi:hypothetical protein
VSYGRRRQGVAGFERCPKLRQVSIRARVERRCQLLEQCVETRVIAAEQEAQIFGVGIRLRHARSCEHQTCQSAAGTIRRLADEVFTRGSESRFAHASGGQRPAAHMAQGLRRAIQGAKNLPACRLWTPFLTALALAQAAGLRHVACSVEMQSGQRRFDRLDSHGSNSATHTLGGR